MKLSFVLLALCVAAATAANIRGDGSDLHAEVDAARNGAEAASGAAAAASGTSGEPEPADDKASRDNQKEAAAAADESKAHMAATQMIATSEKRWGEVSENCATEKKEVTEWINNPVVNVEKMTKRRLAAEKKLLAALMSRVEGLRNFIARIKLTRKRLRKHIIAVNALFKLKFDENMGNVGAATGVLADIGHLKLAPYNPKLNKIKQFKSFGEPASLIQITANALKGKTNCADKDECSGATKLAFQAYRKGLELNKAMGVNFEKERQVLGGMRDKIRELLDKKTAKLNKLLAQIERIKGAMADDDYDAAKKSLGDHLTILGKSCAGMEAFAKGLKSRTSKLLGAMENKGEIPAKAENVKVDGASSGSSTGSEQQ
jgi:hypothetical protein